MDGLHPRLNVRNDAIYAEKAQLHRWAYADISKIRVCASTFVYPHLLVGADGGRLLLPLAVPVPGVPKESEVPVDLVRMFKGLADPTRLKIVRSLAAQPHCTQQLAQIHGVSEAAVSKHLKVLTEARFVSSQRRGNYVFYRLELDEMDMLLVYLRDFLEQ